LPPRHRRPRESVVVLLAHCACGQHLGFPTKALTKPSKEPRCSPTFCTRTRVAPSARHRLRGREAATL
jgi:hypothetical protein